MGNINEMAGVGMPTEHAKAWVGSKDTAAAAGSTNADATALGLSGVITVTGADDAKGVILNAAVPVDSSQIIHNTAAGDLLVYPASGASINGLTATTGGWTLGGNQSGIIARLSATAYAAIGAGPAA